MTDERTAELVEALTVEHRSVVAEYSGNMAGHAAIREGWLEPDPDDGWPAAEPCDVCDLIVANRGGDRCATCGADRYVSAHDPEAGPRAHDFLALTPDDAPENRASGTVRIEALLMQLVAERSALREVIGAYDDTKALGRISNALADAIEAAR